MQYFNIFLYKDCVRVSLSSIYYIKASKANLLLYRVSYFTWYFIHKHKKRGIKWEQNEWYMMLFGVCCLLLYCLRWLRFLHFFFLNNKIYNNIITQMRSDGGMYKIFFLLFYRKRWKCYNVLKNYSFILYKNMHVFVDSWFMTKASLSSINQFLK